MKRLMMLVLGAFVITGLATQHVVAAETKPKGRTTKKATKKRTASKKQDRKTVAECRTMCHKQAKSKIWKLDAEREGFAESAKKALEQIKTCQRTRRR